MIEVSFSSGRLMNNWQPSKKRTKVKRRSAKNVNMFIFIYLGMLHSLVGFFVETLYCRKKQVKQRNLFIDFSASGYSSWRYSQYDIVVNIAVGWRGWGISLGGNLVDDDSSLLTGLLQILQFFNLQIHLLTSELLNTCICKYMHGKKHLNSITVNCHIILNFQGSKTESVGDKHDSSISNNHHVTDTNNLNHQPIVS
jgi:hypothetical protein